MCNDDAAPSIGADASFFDDLAWLGHFRFYLGSKLLGGITYGLYARDEQLFLDSGVEVVGSTPDELGRKVKSEIVLWSKIIKDAGLRQD